jgi:SAM-dependent methyltransferase
VRRVSAPHFPRRNNFAVTSPRYNGSVVVPEQKKSRFAGNSSSETVDVEALFKRLVEEIGHSRGLDLTDGFDRRTARRRLRSVAERWWPVSADRSLVPRPGVRGRLLHPVKRVLRKLMRWYVEPFAADQRAFNDASLKLVDHLFVEVDVLLAELERIENEVAARRDDRRRTEELDQRLTRLERRGGGEHRTVAAQPKGEAMDDYFAFEVRMRPSEDVRERQAVHVERFRDAAPVLDVGCGRGEFLSLLRDAGIEASGVDADADMVAFARGEGHEVVQADALAHLEKLEDDSLGGIFAGQVVEHLPPRTLVRFLALAHDKLRPGGVFVAETINPLSPIAFRHYFADLTHAQPLVPETLELLVRAAGFAEVETQYLNEPAESERLRAVELPAAAEFDAARVALAANVERINRILFGPLDYAVNARA